MAGPKVTPQQTVTQLVGAPVMITLPTAYLVARLFTDYVNLPNILAALIASLLVYAGDWYTADPEWEWPRDYVGRLIYVVINLTILMSLLTGTVTLGEGGG